MAKYVLRADNPSKLASEKYIYFAEGAWSTNIEGGRVFPTKKAAEIALKNNPTHLNAEVIDIEGFKEDAVDGDGDGLVQDGTPFERPAPKTPTKRTRRPRTKKPE
jgi:hypothetical protein